MKTTIEQVDKQLKIIKLFSINYARDLMITVVTTGLAPILSKYDYPALKLKIGIDEGENVVVQYGYDRSSQIDILGYTMNVTAKITSITGPNKISAGENIYKLLHPN